MSKRTKIVVDPSVQWTLARRILAHWGVFVASLFVISVAIRTLLNTGNGSIGAVLVDALLAQLPMVGVLLFFLPIFARDTLRLSHRFVGPMYRLRSEMHKVAQGKMARELQFRENDFWHDAATDFNLILQRLHAVEEENESLRSQLNADRELCQS